MRLNIWMAPSAPAVMATHRQVVFITYNVRSSMALRNRLPGVRAARRGYLPAPWTTDTCGNTTDRFHFLMVVGTPSPSG
jgi:hypothetical protein